VCFYCCFFGKTFLFGSVIFDTSYYFYYYFFFFFRFFIRVFAFFCLAC
jgi:hypothetical protein